MEPKYPVEPLPHLLLPPDYLHHPLFFDTELRDDSPAITEGRRRHNDPCAAVAADHSYLCRELNFSVQDPNRRESGGRPRTKHRRHSHERSSSRRERNDRRGTPPRSRSRSAAGVKRNGHPTTRSAQLREQYIFQKEMDRLLEAEQAAHDAAADIKPLPPAPAVEHVDENMLRPTRAAQLRWDYLAKKRHAAVEVENNIYFVKGQDTSRGAAVQRAAPADPSQSLSSGRLTKAAQLLREHTTRRMKDLEESQQRRRQEEEESDLTFQPALSRRTGGRGSTTTASRSDEPSIVPRPTRAGELRRQHIAEREEAMEKERAVEQAAIDAILKGPRRHRRSTAVPAVDDTSRGKKLSDGQRQGIPVKKERSSRGNERNGATMTAPQRTPMYGTEVGLPTGNKIPTEGTTIEAAHFPPTSLRDCADERYAAPLPESHDPSLSSSGSSSISFYVEVLQKGESVNRNQGRELEATDGDGMSWAGSPAASSAVSGGGTELAESVVSPTRALTSNGATTVVDLTPIASASPSKEKPTHSHRAQDDAASSRASEGQSSPAQASPAKDGGRHGDDSLEQAELLRRLRGGTRRTSSVDGSHVRIPVLFTTDNEEAPVTHPATTTAPSCISEVAKAAPTPERRSQTRHPNLRPSSESSSTREMAPRNGAATAAEAVRNGQPFQTQKETPLAKQNDPAFGNTALGSTPVTRSLPVASPLTPVLSTVPSTTDVPSTLLSVGNLGQPMVGYTLTSQQPTALLFAAFTHGNNSSLPALDDTVVSVGGATASTVKGSQVTRPPGDASRQGDCTLLQQSPVKSTGTASERDSRRTAGDRSMTILHMSPSHAAAAVMLDAKLNSTTQGAVPLSREDRNHLVESAVIHAAPPARGQRRQEDQAKPTPAVAPTPNGHANNISALQDGSSVCSRVSTATTPIPLPEYGVLTLSEPASLPTPPRDVARREPVATTRKVPKEYSPPPAEQRNQRGTNTPPPAPPFLVKKPPVNSVTTIGVRVLVTVTPSPPDSALSVPTEVVEPAVCQDTPELIQEQPPQRATALQKSRGEAAVSVRPRTSNARRLLTSSSSSSLLKSARARTQAARSNSSATAAVAEEPVEAAPSPPTETPLQASPKSAAEEDTKATSVLSTGSTKGALTLPLSDRSPEAPSPPPLQPGATTQSVLTATLSLSVSMDFSAREKDPKPPPLGNLAPLYDDTMEASKCSTAARSTNCPVSHAPTPVRVSTEAAVRIPATPPEGSSFRQIPSPITESVFGTQLILPERSLPRSASESLSQQFPPHSLSPRPQRRTSLSSPPATPSNPSSSLTSLATPVPSGVGMPTLQTEEKRIGAEEDHPAGHVPTAQPGWSAFSNSSSSFVASASERALSHPSVAVEVPDLKASSVGANGRSVSAMESANTHTFVGNDDTQRFDDSSVKAESPLGESSMSRGRKSGASQSVEDFLRLSAPDGVANREAAVVVDNVLELGDRPPAPVPTPQDDRSVSVDRQTGVTTWSAGSPMDYCHSGGTLTLSEQGRSAEELTGTFGPANTSPPVSPPLQPRYLHTDL